MSLQSVLLLVIFTCSDKGQVLLAFLHAIISLFRELDRDGDGRVSYKDFDFMMKFDPLS